MDIADLEKKWRMLAEAQAAAKRDLDDTIRQMEASGVDPDAEPAVAIVRQNLDKIASAYQEASAALVEATSAGSE